MTTKAELLKAAKAIIAAQKKPVKRKANPAKRIGTKKPTRKSQITKQAPTKRLVKRRKANTEKGYFPNPSAYKGGSVSDHKKVTLLTTGLKYFVQAGKYGKWRTYAVFRSFNDAELYANNSAVGSTDIWRVVTK